jgi:hypothetical protein
MIKMPRKKQDIKIVNADEVDQLEPDLEEKGYKRDEQLAKRKDALQQAAEEAGDYGEKYAFDPDKLEPDNEILQLRDELWVDNKQEGYRYCWVYEGLRGREVTKKRRLGWTVVQSADPECPEIKDARGYRVIGDTILMRVPEERAMMLDAIEEKKRREREDGIGGRLREMGEKYRHKGLIVHDDASKIKSPGGGNLIETMQSKARGSAAARSIAQKGVDKMIRQGTVPGMPVPGKGGA